MKSYLNFSVGGNSDGEVDSDKEDGDEIDKKENSEKNNSEGKLYNYNKIL